MMTKIIVVKAAYDAESSVWFVESSDLPGLNAEAETIKTLFKELPAVIGDLLAEGGFVCSAEAITESGVARCRVFRSRVPEKINSKHTANNVLTDAGLPKAF